MGKGAEGKIEKTGERVLARGPFKLIKHDLRSDSRGRITIGHEVVGDTQYRALVNNLGQIVLDPVVSVPAREVWLFQNREALASVVRGVEQAKRGEFGSFPSFASHVNEPDDDESEAGVSRKVAARRRKA